MDPKNGNRMAPSTPFSKGSTSAGPLPTGGGIPGSKTPRIRIPIHVFVYSVMFAPVAAYCVYYNRNKQSDEELEKELEKDGSYSSQIRESQAKRQDMVKFLENIKHPGINPDAEKQMHDVLYAGKSDKVKKRLHAVDESLGYGTEEGGKRTMEMQKKAVEEHKRKVEEKKGQRRKEKEAKKRKKQKKKSDQKEGLVASGSGGDGEGSVDGRVRKVPMTAAVAVAGTVAVAAIGFLIGGRPRSS